MSPLQALAVSLVAAACSALAYVGVLISFDRHEKEPWPFMLFAFGWGAAPAVLLSLFAEQYVGATLHFFVQPGEIQLVFSSVVAPLIEEFAKAVPVVVIFWWYRHEFDGLLDGLLYGSLAGFGFAMTENVFYFTTYFNQDAGLGWHVVFLRSLVFGLNHALYCSCLGLGLAVARFAKRRTVRLLAPTLGLALGVALHMFHNYSVMTHDTWAPALISNWSGVAIWLLLVGLALHLEARCMRQELREEMQAGLITQRDWRTVTRHRKRVVTKLASMHQASAEVWNHYFSLLAELAFKKRQHRIHPDDAQALAHIELLRAEIQRTRSVHNLG